MVWVKVEEELDTYTEPASVDRQNQRTQLVSLISAHHIIVV